MLLTVDAVLEGAVVTLLVGIAAWTFGPFGRILWSEFVLWRCRARLSHIEDTIASIEGKSSFPVRMVSAMVAVEHPAEVEKQRRLLEAEREYYARRVEVMEGRR